MKPGKIKLLVTVAGALVGLSYWVVSFCFYPDEPFFVKVVYRIGDLQYFPLIESLARLDFSPTYSSVFAGTGLVRFPLPPLIPHAIGFALAGAAGMMLMDAVAVAVAGYAFYWLFRIASAPRHLAAVLALACLSTSFILPGYGMLYGFRLPRPEVSNIFVTLFLGYVLLWIRRPSRILQRPWRIVAIGALTSLLLQSSVYFFLIAVTVLAAIVVESLVSRRVGLDRYLGRAFSLFVFSFLIVSIPFAVQSLWGEPDLAARFGLYPAERRGVVMVTYLRPLLAAVSVPVLAAGLTLFLLHRRGHNLRIAAALCSLPLLAAGAAVCFFAFSPVFVQIYHVPFSVADVGRFVVLLLIPQWVRLVPVRLPPRWTSAVTVASIAALLAVSYAWHYRSLPRAKVTGSGDFFAADRGRLRSDVATVIRQFGAPSGARARQLLTNDHHVLVWWTMARQGTLLMPDVFDVVLKDSQIETQLVQVGKYLGWSGTTWSDYVNQDTVGTNHVGNSVLLYFHSHDKYQASSLYTQAPLSDYPAQLRPVISESTSNWSLALPFAARQRLDAAYATTEKDPRFAPDLIVWGKYRNSPDISPPHDYRQILDLANFTVWRKDAD
ncbi:hypothetical protein [Methylomonas methanica]|uniref:Glycosyltransferase RgtA/B/C/D-like domain-containing protein n=1 Tax=Methylomonas methanica (strain DSM 25384 / MC09) TaxID=857087 RepID=F9ZW65_METMM|nr:hypothetical protein [Methylomonas methanica]AEG02036.1 hypothetical protein Metme_3675 [Methylomonas methanica MC09]